MILYISTILISMIIIFVCNALFQSAYYIDKGIWILMLTITIAVVFAFVIDLIVSAIVMLLPKSANKPFKKVFKWERKFYNKIKIKLWKDKIPIGRGPIMMGMKKDAIYKPNDNVYLGKLIDECYKAEIMHFVSMFAGFLVLIILPKGCILTISLPVAVVNIVLQYLPFIVQRYNIPKLEILYRRNEKNRDYSL